MLSLTWTKTFNLFIFLWLYLLFKQTLISLEASYFDRLNMTINRLEYDQKIITPMNMNNGTWPKDYTNEHERLNMTEIPMKMTKILKWQKCIRMTNLNGWIWPIKFRSHSPVNVCRCHTFSVKFHLSCSLVWSFRSCTNFSVIFIRSCWFGQMIYPLSLNKYVRIFSYYITNYNLLCYSFVCFFFQTEKNRAIETT